MSPSPPDVPGKDATPASTAEPTPGKTLPPSKRWPSVRFLALSLWVAVAVLVVIAFLEGPITRTAALWTQATNWTVVLATIRIVAYFVLLVGFFWLGARLIDALAARGFLQMPTGIRQPPAEGEGKEEAKKEGEKGDKKVARGVPFPVPPTIPIGVWLALITLALVVGLLETLAPTFFILERFPELSCGTGDQRCVDRLNLLVSIFAAGVGAMVTTIAGYLEHASEVRDFEVSYVPWYFARPATGMLLGIVYYFVMKGGLFMTVGEVQSTELNPYGIAAVAALVGLFSKQAVEKLREVFETLFITRTQVTAELKRRQEEEDAAVEEQPQAGEPADQTTPGRAGARPTPS